MKRSSAWYLAVLLVAGCGGGSEAGEAEMAEMAETAEAMDEMADAGLACVVMGDVEGRASPLQELSFSYDGGEGLLCYGAPSARERVVMGELVPYGEVWRLGANEATALHLSAAATVGGVALGPGSYSLYATPGETEWEFHVNSEYDRWGIPIDAVVQSTEVGSFMATPSATAGMVEMMTFEQVDGALRFSWENTQVDIPLGM
ncbi:DUF2911 domain-containing protein [Candidatus Palauibacter soopunensis]|uniref:DUF2911 domain-containing protein n=1 Tax=Candidatus Palauibacter soopunensis TaxID=3056739 RepID=UPI00238A8496|nr:DUF2911 domain-containing protein [Candidatus Palauibacter soopunensis]MDE2877354.1 DUF2911 domain-containing protein [Candidatus Palauibacter soopunensis]